jgi:hypothetical protein
MDSLHSVVAAQHTQERIARAQAERLAREARRAPSRERRRRTFRFLHRPIVALTRD